MTYVGCRWVSLRLQAISVTVVFATAVTVVMLLGDKPGLAGLALTSALNTTGILEWLVQEATGLEVEMNRHAFPCTSLSTPPSPFSFQCLSKKSCSTAEFQLLKNIIHVPARISSGIS